MANNIGYLITPTNTLSSFILGADRAYFSNPVQVELLYSEISTHHLYVRDPKRGHTYPTNQKWVVPERHLTNKQRKAAS